MVVDEATLVGDMGTGLRDGDECAEWGRDGDEAVSSDERLLYDCCAP